MINWLKSIFRPVRRIIQARYNSASMSESSQKNFAGADYYSADAAMQRHIRLLIAVRARNEFANNSFAYGIINTLADDTVGTGPRLQLENDESLANISDAKAVSLQHIERRFHQWADEVGLNGLLRCARIAKAVDGETFIRLLRNPGTDREIQLEPRIFEAECVASETLAETPLRYQPSGEPFEVDGILYDQYGNPTKYRFWRVHPGSPTGALPYSFYMEDSAHVIHYGNFFRAGQHRGLSEMTAALHIFNDLRRYSTAVILGAEVAARLSFIISNDLPPELYESTVEVDENGRLAQTALDLTGPKALRSGDFNSLVLPAGYHASQMKSEQPTQSYVAFKDSKIAEAARVFSMPFNVAAGNSSGYNYASGRLDHQVYNKKLLIERGVIGTVVLEPIYKAWSEQDRLLHPADYQGELFHSWMWDGFEHVDPVKEANAQAARLANGVTSLSEECAREGRDYYSVLRRRKRELEDCKRMGMEPLPWMNATPVLVPEGQEGGDK